MVSEKGEAMRFAIELAERGLLPDSLIRWGIRELDKKRLRLEDLGDSEKQGQALERFIEELRKSPLLCKYTNRRSNITNCHHLFLKKSWANG
jgi:hypothetical protein